MSRLTNQLDMTLTVLTGCKTQLKQTNASLCIGYIQGKSLVSCAVFSGSFLFACGKMLAFPHSTIIAAPDRKFSDRLLKIILLCALD